MLLVFVALAVLLGWYSLWYTCVIQGKLNALCWRDVEVVFSVVNDQTKEPIVGATINWQVEQFKLEQEKREGRPTKVQFVTGESGKAVLLLKNVPSENVCRPYRKIETFVALWGTVEVVADGYWPLDYYSLFSGQLGQHDLGYFAKERVQRIQIKLPLAKK